MHNLIHLADDVENFNISLSHVSTFWDESYIGNCLLLRQVLFQLNQKEKKTKSIFVFYINFLNLSLCVDMHTQFTYTCIIYIHFFYFRDIICRKHVSFNHTDLSLINIETPIEILDVESSKY